MKTLKMSLENIQGKMNRKEMRNIMAGSDVSGSGACPISTPCSNSSCLLEVVIGGANKYGTCKSFTYSANGNSITSCMCQ